MPACSPAIPSEVTDEVRANAHRLHAFGGSPIGNSRVKLTNVDDCVKRGLVQPGQDPLHVAAEQLSRDGVDVLHTIGGDDTNGTAADLAAYLREQRLPADGRRAAQDHRQRHRADPAVARRVDRRRAGRALRPQHHRRAFVEPADAHRPRGDGPQLRVARPRPPRSRTTSGSQGASSPSGWRIPPPAGTSTRVFVPERPFDIAEEAKRLRAIMDERDCVNLFISEGAGVSEIVAAMEAAGEDVPRDPFGHVQLDKINPGQWFAKQFAAELGADKVLVQKSGYFSRSAAAERRRPRADPGRAPTYAVDAALRGESGVVGQDEERGDELRAIEFERIAGGKAFDASVPWFTDLLRDLGQA